MTNAQGTTANQPEASLSPLARAEQEGFSERMVTLPSCWITPFATYSSRYSSYILEECQQDIDQTSRLLASHLKDITPVAVVDAVFSVPVYEYSNADTSSCDYGHLFPARLYVLRARSVKENDDKFRYVVDAVSPVRKFLKECRSILGKAYRRLNKRLHQETFVQQLGLLPERWFGRVEINEPETFRRIIDIMIARGQKTAQAVLGYLTYSNYIESLL